MYLYVCLVLLLTTNVNALFITLFSCKFTWYTLHKLVLSQLCMEGMQSQCRSPRHGGIELLLDFQHLLAQSQGFDQHIQTYCDGNYSVQPSGSRCTRGSRREGRWSLQVSSAPFLWWKHSTLHTVHSDHEMLTMVHLWSHTQTHIDNHEAFEYQICTVSSLGHLVGKCS